MKLALAGVQVREKQTRRGQERRRKRQEEGRREGERDNKGAGEEEEALCWNSEEGARDRKTVSDFRFH